MQLHDFGEWIKLEYFNDKVEYTQDKNKSLIDVRCVSHLLDGQYHKDEGAAVSTYSKSGTLLYEKFYRKGKYRGSKDHRKKEKIPPGITIVNYNTEPEVIRTEYYGVSQTKVVHYDYNYNASKVEVKTYGYDD